MRSITRLVIHCSATPNGVWIAPEQIDAWHRERGLNRDPSAARKFRPHLPHIGYHRLIEPDGSTAYTRDLEEEAALDPPGSVSICMVGTGAFFARQWDGLRRTVFAVALRLAERVEHRVKWDGGEIFSAGMCVAIIRAIGVEVVGHRELGSEAAWGTDWLRVCPGFDVRAWLDRGMEPEAAELLDGHPAIAQADSIARAMSAMRYGAL